MKCRKVLKIIMIVLLVIVIIAVYEFIGIFAEYKKQPEVSEKTRNNFHLEKFYENSENQERAAVIEDNGEALTQRLRLIQNAEKEIVISTFAFHSDNSGQIMIGALLDAADRGVKVRILADGFESIVSMEMKPAFYALSSHENIEIKIYNQANPFKPWKMMGRMHDKYLIADEQIYLLGGRNTFDFFLGDFPGHKNFDRDVLVYCENPQKENSVMQLTEYFEKIWEQKDCRLFHEKASLAKRKSVKKADADSREAYEQYYEAHKETIDDLDYVKDTFETEKIILLSNPIHTQAKEPVVWYQLGELMKNAKQKVKIHTPYIICNEMMYDTWEQVSAKVSDFSVMTNSVGNNGNPFGSADYAKYRNRILDTGIDIWEYEGGYSYHGKSILIDDDISIIGSFNMDMRSVYLDTELMLVVRSREVNAQLAEGMMEYEKVSRQVLKDGSYYDPYHVDPVVLSEKRRKGIVLIHHLLGWARFLF